MVKDNLFHCTLIMGAYTGYFGAAGGVIVLVLLTYITNERFIVINAIKNVICGFANLVALIIFIFTSHIYWLQAIPISYRDVYWWLYWTSNFKTSTRKTDPNFYCHIGVCSSRIFLL